MRVGVVGYGYIGRDTVARLRAGAAPGAELAFVHNRSPAALAALPAGLVLPDLADFAARRPDLIVELAHPAITARHGVAFLAQADYLPISVTALADARLEAALRAAAAASGHQIFLPHGALVGVDNLVEAQAAWAEVTITFRKNPANIDFRESGISPDIAAETVVYDGPARGIAALFPRNVNTMVTCALASVGLDRCRAVLVADPSLDMAIAEMTAIGHDGRVLHTSKRQPVVGVSGTEMLDANWQSVLRALGTRMGGLVFV